MESNVYYQAIQTSVISFKYNADIQEKQQKQQNKNLDNLYKQESENNCFRPTHNRIIGKLLFTLHLNHDYSFYDLV